MEASARNFCGPTRCMLITTNSCFLIRFPATFTELGSHPAKSDKLIMPDCCRTKGTQLLSLTDLQPVALKRLSIASVGVFKNRLLGDYRTSIQAKLHDTETYVDCLLRTGLIDFRAQ